MNLARLQDRLSRGMGLAAEKYGSLFTVYRPSGVNDPISDANRIIQIYAALQAVKTGSDIGHAAPFWSGIFDTLYTHQGDYLVSDSQTFFIQSLPPQRSAQCVLTNRIVTIVRPGVADQGQYSGLYASPGEIVLSNWPAGLFASGGRVASSNGMDRAVGDWTMLLPSLPVMLRASDVISDDAGSTYVAGAAEATSSGWRVLLRQVGQ